ncbi:MAG: RNA polymerase sporulation sigma factor SigK [Lachnospiraceae bacterium]|nr:RNA polymerase sporulation sigma factor SigK [Lachnospiraceae bacterium]
MKTFLPPLTKEEEAYYISKFREGDKKAKDVLIEHNMRLVAHIVKKYHQNDRELEELISIGTIGLIKGVNSFDETKGNRLVTYAAKCIENELLMNIRLEKKKAKEVSIYESIGTDKEGNEISLLDVIGNNDENTLNVLILSDNVVQLYEVLNRLPDDKSKQVIVLRYGLYGRNPMTQKQVANLLGISRSYVSRIEKKALLTLRHKMEE